MHESKFPFVSRIEFIRSKLWIFSAHVSGVSESSGGVGNLCCCVSVDLGVVLCRADDIMLGKRFLSLNHDGQMKRWGVEC